MQARRNSETNKVIIHGTMRSSLYLTYSFNTRGTQPTIQEAFCSVEKTGSDERAYMDTIARLVSRLLRHESVEEVATCLEGVVTSIRGPVEGIVNERFCHGYIDCFGKGLLRRQEELNGTQR